MKIEKVIIPGSRGRYGRSTITINVFYNGTHLGHEQEYKAIAGFKYGVFIEDASTAVKAIKKAEKRAVKHQNFIIEQRKAKSKHKN